MEHIKVAKVDHVNIAAQPYPAPPQSKQEPGSLQLTPHHLIFRYDDTDQRSNKELWLPLPLISSFTLHPITPSALSPLVIRTRHFHVYTLYFKDHLAANQVFDSCKGLVTHATIQSMYAFCQPSTSKRVFYEPEQEYARMGAISHHSSKTRSNAWRWSDVNANFEFCSTYPAKLAVPSKISDVTLKYGKGYRSKHRVPALVYLHWNNLGSITRASQPMVGLKNARSIQDEKLIEAIFHSHAQHTTSNVQVMPSSVNTARPVYGAKAANLIIDARPTTNAMANSVKGAGTENMEHYKDCKKAYLGIDNIHVMRDSLRAIVDALVASESSGSSAVDQLALRRSGWLKHLSAILEGSLLIIRNVHVFNSHVLVHCSDGWDRTAQLSALSQICLDPFYRTIAGFSVLVEKDFVSFGHKFNHRAGHTVPDRTLFVTVPGTDVSPQAAFLATVQKGLAFSSAAFKETSPVFHQFLDCVHQLLRQFPDRFQFDERFLRDLLYQLYACEYGTFLFDSEQERQNVSLPSVWSLYIDDAGQPKQQWLNPTYDPTLDDPASRHASADQGVLMPNPKNVAYWYQLFQKSDQDMNLPDEDPVQDVEVVDVESAREDPAMKRVLAPSDDAGLVEHVGKMSVSGTWQPPNIPPAISAQTQQAQVQLSNAVNSMWRFGKSLKQGYSNVVKDFQQAQAVTPPQTPLTQPSLRQTTPASNRSMYSNNPWRTAAEPVEQELQIRPTQRQEQTTTTPTHSNTTDTTTTQTSFDPLNVAQS